jgi:hypothetical protein
VAMKRQIDEMSEKMHYVEGASGLAVAIGDTIVALDIFDKPTTCMKVWNRLLSGFLMDALGGGAEKAKNATIEDVERLLGQITETEWKKVETVGEGDEYRTDLGKDQGSILAIKDTLVHGSVLKAPK